MLFAVGVESVVAHPLDVLPAYDRILLAEGMALVLLAIVAAVHRAVRRVPAERLVAGVLLLGFAAAGSALAAVWFAVVTVGLVAGALLVERNRMAYGQPGGA